MTTLITQINSEMYATSDLQKCANCSHGFLATHAGGRVTRQAGGMTITTVCERCGHDHQIDYVEVDHTIRFSFKSGDSVFNVADVCKCRGCRDGYLASEVLEMAQGIVMEAEGLDYVVLTCPFCATVSYVRINREDNLQVIEVAGDQCAVAKRTDCTHCDHRFTVGAAIDHDVSSILNHCPKCGKENWILAEWVFDSDEYAEGYALTVVTHNAVIFKLPAQNAVIHNFDKISSNRYADLCQFLSKCWKRTNHYYAEL